jgi:hypothetical protein
LENSIVSKFQGYRTEEICAKCEADFSFNCKPQFSAVDSLKSQSQKNGGSGGARTRFLNFVSFRKTGIQPHINWRFFAFLKIDSMKTNEAIRRKSVRNCQENIDLNQMMANDRCSPLIYSR